MFYIGIVSIVFSLRVDRLYENKITWTDKYKDAESQEYQQLEHESVRAVSAKVIILRYYYNIHVLIITKLNDSKWRNLSTNPFNSIEKYFRLFINYYYLLLIIT